MALSLYSSEDGYGTHRNVNRNSPRVAEKYRLTCTTGHYVESDICQHSQQGKVSVQEEKTTDFIKYHATSGMILMHFIVGTHMVSSSCTKYVLSKSTHNLGHK